jgi:hypothetical protein
MSAYLLPSLLWLLLLVAIIRDAKKYERSHPLRKHMASESVREHHV